MRHSERASGRGLARTAASDWRAADLPAALQGGARQAIFRGLYKGVEAAAGRPGSSSTREGRGDTIAGSRDAGVARFGLCAGLDPNRRRRDLVRIREIGGAVPGSGLGCLLREQPSGASGSLHSASLPSTGKEGSEGEARLRDSVTYPKLNPRAPSEFPSGSRDEAAEEEVPYNG